MKFRIVASLLIVVVLLIVIALTYEGSSPAAIVPEESGLKNLKVQ